MLKIKFVFFITLLTTSALGQNKQLLYGIKEIPQSLMVNPGGEVDFDKHIGIPFLSGIHANLGSNNITVNDLFADDGVDINDKIRDLIFSLKSKDFVSVNEQIEVINIGLRLKNEKDYLSFGFYQELDFISYYPKDMATVFYQGNTDADGNVITNTEYDINDVSLKGEVIGVLHAGISRKINGKLNIGARAKLYLGAYNVKSVNNKGKLSTQLGQNNLYEHVFENLDFSLQTSGLGEPTGLKNALTKNLVKNMLFGGNLGLGFDLGFTYHMKENITITGSVLDLGFISYSNDVTTYTAEGTHVVEGIGLLFPPASDPIDYWDNLISDFDEQIPRDTLNTTYVSFRSPKVNTGLHYGFGHQKRKYKSTVCPFINYLSAINFQNEIGVQLYSVFRPKGPQLAATLYYNRSFSRFLKAKVTYSVDPYSFSNIGLGFSTQIGKFNFYATADNLLRYDNLYNSKKISVLFGANLILAR